MLRTVTGTLGLCRSQYPGIGLEAEFTQAR